MSQDKSREEFEAWALSPGFGLTPGHLVIGPNGYYVNYPTQCYWEAWQASREAIVVKLPMEDVDEGFIHINPIRDAIKAAGLKVAP